MIIRTAIVVAVCLVALGPVWAQTANRNPDSIAAAKLGTTSNVHRCGDLFTAGQFSQDDIPALKEAGIKRVITLRTEGEIDWDEKSEIEKAGIEFIEVPFRTPESLTDEVFDEIRELLQDQDGVTLFHCGSANRVGGTWLPYRVLDQGVDLPTALAEAKEIGLRTEFIEEKALDYIKRRMAARDREDSVKPGINKSFLDPDLDIEEFIERFEVESREVFLCREKILAACEIKKGHKIADVGAGTGLFTRLFAIEVGSDGWVYAVDIVPRFIGHINDECQKLNLTNVTGVVCTQRSIQLPPNSVDLVFICDTYHHFEYPTSTLASIRRALTAGGRLVIIDFERIPGKSRAWLLDHVRAGKEVFQAEIEEAGFALKEEKDIPGFEENYFLVFEKK